MEILIRIEDLKSVWKLTKRTEERLCRFGCVKRVMRKFKDKVNSSFFPGNSSLTARCNANVLLTKIEQ